VALKSGESASEDQQKLGIMLAAVSKMAQNGDAGCSGSGGEKNRCVVEKLSKASRAGTFKLEDGDDKLGPQVAAAVQRALDDRAMQQRLGLSISSATLAAINANLSCEDDSRCRATVPTPTTGTVADAITATKAMLTQLRSDFNALATSAEPGQVSAAETELNKFGSRMQQVQVPAELMIRDTTAVMLGVELWNDFQAGRSGNQRGKWRGDFATGGFAPSEIPLGGVGCTVYEDVDNKVPATSPATAKQVGCSARYFLDFPAPAAGTLSTAPTEYAHGFTILPPADTAVAGTGTVSFTYKSSAFSRVRSAPVLGDQVFLGTRGRTGTITATVTAAGELSALQVTGLLPGAFKFGGNTLVDDHQQWSMNLTRSGTPTTTTTVAVSGSVASMDANNAVLGTLTVNSGSVVEVPVGTPAELKLNSAALDIGWETAGAAFHGTFAVGDRITNAEGGGTRPANVSLGGVFTTIDNGVRTDFASGTFKVAFKGFDTFTPSLPVSSTNTFTSDASFTGSVTAPGRPLLMATLALSTKGPLFEPSAALLQYRSVVNGTPRATIDLSANLAAAGGPTFTLKESSVGISLTVTEGAKTADVLLNGTTKIGVLDFDHGVLTFADGTSVSVDLKLGM
jgi:hypothetical protein